MLLINIFSHYCCNLYASVIRTIFNFFDFKLNEVVPLVRGHSLGMSCKLRGFQTLPPFSPFFSFFILSSPSLSYKVTFSLTAEIQNYEIIEAVICFMTYVVIFVIYCHREKYIILEITLDRKSKLNKLYDNIKS